jgi:hypothetical protein
VLVQEPPLHLAAVDALGDADGRELRKLEALVGEELEPALPQPRLESGARLRVAEPAGLEPLLEQKPQRLVQGVDQGGRRSVVVGGRPLDPVAGKEREVEDEGSGARRARMRSSARSESRTGDMPGGAPRHFWVHE